VLPDGFRPLSLPEPVGLETPFGSYSLRWEQDGTTLRVRRDLALAATRIEPADYPAFRRFVTAVEQANRRVVVVSAAGASGPEQEQEKERKRGRGNGPGGAAGQGESAGEGKHKGAGEGQGQGGEEG